MTKLWGGRFSKKINPLVDDFTKSIHIDQKLAYCDVWGSLFHIDVLKEAKLLTKEEYQKLHDGLHKILDSIQNGSFKPDLSSEDIHTNIQNVLEKKVGEVALKLHTCRSRNDQIVFDMKLYCRLELNRVLEILDGCKKSLYALADKNKSLYMPGYTHLQHAIPIHIGDYLMAYVEMLNQDERRLTHIQDNINLTMGSGALAGTFIEAEHYNQAMKSAAVELGIVKPSTNSIYTVSDRDFILEILSALAIVGMHLSRLAEDFILWSTKEFDFIDIDDAFCTGSSLMPQKKNPDVLELIRGYSGRLYGNLVNMLVLMKGLPLSYNRDMQHDKEPLFDSLSVVENELKVLTELLKNVSFKKETLAKQLADECLYATDMADHLVQNGVAFKQAHHIIGRLIHYKLQTKNEIVSMSKEELVQFHPALTPSIVQKIIDPAFSVGSKKSIRRKKGK